MSGSSQKQGSKDEDAVESLITRSRTESKLKVDEALRATGHSNLDRIAQVKMSEDLEKKISPELISTCEFWIRGKPSCSQCM